jgi:hypothetical protein
VPGRPFNVSTLFVERAVTLPKVTGTYEVDVENSAKLVAGFFPERFVMKPGYDEAVKKYMLENADAAKGISVSINTKQLLIKSPEGEEEFRVLELDDSVTPAKLVVDWGGKTTFKVVEVAPGSIHLQNPNNELGEWIWRRTGDE